MVAAMSALGGCATATPHDIEDACAMFREMDGWYAAAKKAYETWGVPIHVQLAIIHQESRFRARARAPRDTLLGLIPWGRQSTAYGYGQVQDATWAWYKRATGHAGADRDDFEDVTDFIGWYVDLSHRRLGIAKEDAYHQYLAYHEGHGGYARRTYRHKPWLLKVARRVARRAARYRAQLARCRESLEGGFRLWPF